MAIEALPLSEMEARGSQGETSAAEKAVESLKIRVVVRCLQGGARCRLARICLILLP
jgi:hypothetical protein